MIRYILQNFVWLVLLSLISYTSVSAEASAVLTLSPKNPEPNSSVTLTIDSFSFDTDTAMITWSVNGKKILQGQGERSLKIKTGKVGESAEVRVLSETATGISVEQVITVTPSSVTLIYEAPRSYVPLLYEGRSLPSTGGLVKVTAIPLLSDDGRTIPPSSIAYSWYVDDKIVRTSSGIGKQSALIRLNYLEDTTSVKVVARSPKGNTGVKTVSIPSHEIMPLIYTYDPVLGTNFSKLISKRFEAVKDFTLTMEPFYVSDKEVKSPNYIWFLDGLPSTPLGGRILGMSPRENSYGSKILSIVVEGNDRRLQRAETKLELIFDTRK